MCNFVGLVVVALASYILSGDFYREILDTTRNGLLSCK